MNVPLTILVVLGWALFMYWLFFGKRSEPNSPNEIYPGGAA